MTLFIISTLKCRPLCQGGVPGLLLQCREEERVAVGFVWLVKTEDWKTTARSMRGEREEESDGNIPVATRVT